MMQSEGKFPRHSTLEKMRLWVMMRVILTSFLSQLARRLPHLTIAPRTTSSRLFRYCSWLIVIISIYVVPAFGDNEVNFISAQYTTCESHPAAVAIGKLNNDDYQDIAVAHTGIYSGHDTVSILLGNGDGTFKPCVPYSTGGTTPFDVHIADFNSDGKMDLVFPNADSNNVAILIGNGDGTFQAPVTYQAVAYPIKIAVADFNSDNKPDFAVTNHNSNVVSVYLNDGSGRFSSRTDYTVGNTPYAIDTGDFNGDGKADLVLANSELDYDVTNANVGVMIGKGDGTFQNQVTYASVLGVSGVYVADMNGDGKLDLVVSGQQAGIMVGKGDGSFQPPIVSPAAGIPGEFNGDRKMDVATSNDADVSATVSILLGNGDGTLQPPSGSFPAGNSPRGMAVGDLNGDSKEDIVVPDYDVHAPPQDPTGAITVLINTSAGTGPTPDGNLIRIQGLPR